jgi:hypothetical protein
MGRERGTEARYTQTCKSKHASKYYVECKCRCEGSRTERRRSCIDGGRDYNLLRRKTP